jgi:hypothetical protein
MTQKKQQKVVRESARAPRHRVAEVFFEEQEEQAGEAHARETREEA